MTNCSHKKKKKIRNSYNIVHIFISKVEYRFYKRNSYKWMSLKVIIMVSNSRRKVVLYADYKLSTFKLTQ